MDASARPTIRPGIGIGDGVRPGLSPGADASHPHNIPCALQRRFVYALASSPLAKTEPAGIMYISSETEHATFAFRILVADGWTR